MAVPVFYPKAFIVSVGGTICGSIDEITWVREMYEDGDLVTFPTVAEFMPDDLTGPRVAVYVRDLSGMSEVIINMTPYRDGSPIGPTATLILH